MAFGAMSRERLLPCVGVMVICSNVIMPDVGKSLIPAP